MAEADVGAVEEGCPGSKGLKGGALGLLSSTVIGVASTAPGYSLAATLGLVVALVGLQSPSLMWVAFLPMACIAAAYYYLNRADPDCGTTFSWATKAMGPHTGWIGGWAIVVADIVVMASLADITGIYLFKLFGADGLADNTFWVTVLGVLFIVAMTWICYIGIEVSARTQYFLLAMEVIALFTFAAVALLRVYFGHPAGAIHPSLSWLNPFAIHDIHAFTAGILLAIFIYWGWDTAVTVNEEADDTTETPGRAALLSTLALVGIYVVVSVAAQAFHGTKALEDQDDVLAVLAKDVLGPLSKVLIIAVLTSSAASTQTTILPTARTTLSMAAKGAFPKYFARIHPRYLTPTTSTIWMGAISILWYVGLTIGSQNVLADSLDALGLMIAFYYGLTGFVCVIFYRHQLFRSAKNFLLMGLIPLVGGVFLLWAMVKSGIDYAKPENSESGSSWFGLGPPLVIGAASMLLGIVLMVIQQIRHPAFFRRKLEVAPEEGIEAPDALPGEVGLATE